MRRHDRWTPAILRAAIGILLLGATGTLAGCPGGKSSACHSTDDCAGDLECAGPNDPHGCGIPPRQQCATGADCSGERCHAIADPCSADGIGSECRPACIAGGCGDGFRCNAAGACEPVPCDEGFTCPSHQRCDAAVAHMAGPMYARSQGCVDIPCAADTDCPAGKACVNGFCQDGPGSCQEVVIVP